MALSTRALNRFIRLLVRACIGLTLLTTLAPGCMTRKQYAINEAILIGERRQLEDEIYRTQFELRDALVENERLRAELEGRGKDAKPKKNGTSSSLPSSSISYPGGSALQVSPNSVSNALDAYGATGDEEIERLPDFVPVPTSRSKQSEVPASVSRSSQNKVPTPVSRSKQSGVPAPPTLGPTTRPTTTPSLNGSGGSNRGSSDVKPSSRASGFETNPYTFGRNDATRSGTPSQVVSSSYLSSASDSNMIGQTSYQGEVSNSSEIEPWSPLAPY